MSFWGELKRRNVYKVGVAYAIVAWLLIQFAAIAFPHLNFPTWAVPFVIVILIIGFPIALLLAWAYEVTPDGIKRTKEVPLSESITHLTGKKLNYILAGLLVLAIAFLLFDNYYLDRRVIKQEVVSTETEQAPAVSDVEKTKKTIAVLPFVNLSSDSEQEYFVDGLSEEIINSLTQIPNLGVTGRTSSFTFKGSNKKTQEIANELGVENILEGSVRKAGNALRITAQLVRAADDLHLWSKTYDRELKDIFIIQEDIATAVANELKVRLGIEKSFKQLGGTENLQAYELYLIAKGQYNSLDTKGALESLDEALALDPEFALAWASKAIIHIFLTIVGPVNLIATEQKAGLRASLKAIELEPNLAAGYYSLGYASNDLISAGVAYRKALEISNEPVSFIMPVIPIHYLAVGYFERSRELLEKMLQNDPLNQANLHFYIVALGILGDTKQGKEEYERAKALFGNQFGSNTPSITYLRIGSGDPVSRNEILFSEPIFESIKEHLESPEEGLAELRRIYSEDNSLNAVSLEAVILCSAYFGDPEFAMDVLEKRINIKAESIYITFFPVMQELRQLPRYKELIKKIGLIDYWNEFGWPDICHQLDNGDFECD